MMGDGVTSEDAICSGYSFPTLPACTKPCEATLDDDWSPSNLPLTPGICGKSSQGWIQAPGHPRHDHGDHGHPVTFRTLLHTHVALRLLESYASGAHSSPDVPWYM